MMNSHLVSSAKTSLMENCRHPCPYFEASLCGYEVKLAKGPA